MRRALTALCTLAFLRVVPAMADAAVPPAGQPCQPRQSIQLDIRTGAQGHVEVPLEVNGERNWFAVDTGGVFSMITYPLAERLKMKLQPFPYGAQLFGGVELDQAAVADTVKFGRLSTANFGFLAVPQSVFDFDMGGVVGIDILQNYDIDIDLIAGKFGFYAPGPCISPVVDWNHGQYTKIPFTLMTQGHILVTVIIDGKPVKAILDTGSQGTAMTLETAKRIYGIRDDNHDLKVMRPSAINGAKPTLMYRYPFKSLSLGAIEIRDPQIEMLSEEAAGSDAPELLLGLSILRQLHLYIAYRQHMIYATPAELPGTH